MDVWYGQSYLRCADAKQVLHHQWLLQRENPVGRRLYKLVLGFQELQYVLSWTREQPTQVNIWREPHVKTEDLLCDKHMGRGHLAPDTRIPEQGNFISQIKCLSSKTTPKAVQPFVLSAFLEW